MPASVQFEAIGFEDLSPRALHDLLKLRSDVFILEQGITSEADVDGFDPVARHVLGRASDGRLVATARLRLADGSVKVERVAVAKADRGRGIGTELMAFLHAHLGPGRATLSAQTHLLRWYEALGWEPVGETYDEGGVLHRRMVRHST